MWYRMDLLFFICAGLAFISDYADGYFARKLNQTSELGKILDPLADKIIVIAAGVILYIQALLPIYFALIIVFRDIIIFIGGLHVKSRDGKVPPSNMLGKVTVNVISLVLFGIYFRNEYATNYGIPIAIFFAVLSLINYMRRLRG